MRFIQWLIEAEARDPNFWKNILLSNLKTIDDTDINLSTSLKQMKTSQVINTINNLGEFKKLDKELQQQALNKIQSNQGNINDVINILAKK
jgi:hypothetical protein